MGKTVKISFFLAAILGVGIFFYSVSVYEVQAQVSGGNTPPIWITPTSSKTVFVGELLEFTVFAYDPNNDGLTYSVFSLPSGASFNPVSRIFSWRPGSGQTGNFTITFRAFDGFNSSDLNILIVVNSTNFQTQPPFPPVTTTTQPPTFFPNPQPPTTPIGQPVFVNFNPPGTAREGQLYTYTVQAVSPNNFPVFYRLLSAPEGMIINSSLGIIIWVPNFSQGRTEPYNVLVGAANGQYEVTRSFTIRVEDITQVTPPPAVVTPPPTVISPPVVTSPSVVVAPAPPPAPKLLISNLEIRQESGEVIISWDTNKTARSRVIYDTESQADKTEDFTYKNATPDSDPDVPANFVTRHEIRLQDLESGATYYFRAASKRNGEIAISEEQSFIYEGEPQGLAAVVFSSLGELFTNFWFYLFLVISFIAGFIAGRSRPKAPI